MLEDRVRVVVLAALCGAMLLGCGSRSALTSWVNGESTDDPSSRSGGAPSRSGGAPSRSGGEGNGAGGQVLATGGNSAVDPCFGQPCDNEGVCRSAGEEFACTCRPGYVGWRCEVNIDDCPPSECEHGGTCVDGVNDYTCSCLPNYTGKNCEHKQFAPLGPPPACLDEPFAESDLSGDGRVLIGNCGGRAVRWTEEGGFQVLLADAYAARTNRDGSVIVGTKQGGPSAAFRLMIDTNTLDSLPAPSLAMGVSDDGAVVVGEFGENDARRAYRWLLGRTTPEPLGTLPNGEASAAHDVSSAGDVIVGWSFGGGVTRAFRWTMDLGMIDLGVTSNTDHTLANSVSRDGLVVVGGAFSFGPVGNRGFVWDATLGMRDPGMLAGFSSGAWYETDAHGRIALGSSMRTTDSVTEEAAMVWDAEHGVRSVSDVLAEAGADVSGWKLGGVAGISDDGTILGGTGIDPSGVHQPWLARLR